MSWAEDGQRIPDRLPLMDAFLDERAPDGPLQGATAVLIQHQLGSQVPMTSALIALGLDPRRTHWVDIPYTSNPDVHQALLGLGIPEDNFAPSAYHLEIPYAAYQRARVQNLILRLLDSLGPDEPLLVLDDGSYFLEAMSCFHTRLPGLRIVEQTTRGVIKIRSDSALAHYCDEVTVVNVAECRPKKKLEGPLIGEVVCASLIRSVSELADASGGGDCLVLGFGQIGQSVAEALVRDLGYPPASIHVLDPHSRAQRRAQRAGYTVWDRRYPERRRFRLVVGCSGSTSFGIGDRVFLEDGAILASASSGSAELSREAFIELADTHPADDIYVYDRETLHSRSLHSDIHMRLVDRDARFLNGGFPVNFDGRVNCVAPELIQATHVLQVGASLEAMGSTSLGLQDVTDELCRWVERRYTSIALGG